MTEIMMGSYTDQEFEYELKELLRKLLSIPFLEAHEDPAAYLLGGQSGAGKTTLHRVLAEKFSSDVIVINGDEYRSRHPRYRQLDAEYGPESVNYTAPWAGKMTEALIEALSDLGYNLVIEGTLRTSEVPMKTAGLLRAKGYGVSLAVMAVKPEISLVSCQIRYEMMRLAGTVPRATDPAHHNRIVRDIVENIGVLEQSGLFDSVELYERNGECLYSGASDAGCASVALSEKLFGPWSPEETMHCEFLKKTLAELRGKG